MATAPRSPHCQKEDTPRSSRIELRASSDLSSATPSTVSGPSGLTFRGEPRATRAAGSTARDLELRSFVTASPSATDDLIATAARLRSTMVVYWVGEDELFIWVVSPDGGVHSRRVPVRRSRLARAHSRNVAVR